MLCPVIHPVVVDTTSGTGTRIMILERVVSGQLDPDPVFIRRMDPDTYFLVSWFKTLRVGL